MMCPFIMKKKHLCPPKTHEYFMDPETLSRNFGGELRKKQNVSNRFFVKNLIQCNQFIEGNKVWGDKHDFFVLF